MFNPVWSMPGGFTSFGANRNGYEAVDPERDVEAHPKPVPAAPAQPPVQHQAPPANQAPGGYQSM